MKLFKLMKPLDNSKNLGVQILLFETVRIKTKMSKDFKEQIPLVKLQLD